MSQPSERPPTSVEVLVIGAGPTGLTLANHLGGYGIDTLVLEAGETLIDYPRGVGVDDESLRAFQNIGLVDRVLPHTTPNQIMRLVGRDGRRLAEIAPGTDVYGWPRRNGFVQPLVDRELHVGLDRFEHVRVLFSHRMESFRQDGEGVDVHLTGPDSAHHTVRARYVVGADGGRSRTRKLLGADFSGTTDATRWLVVDIRNDPLGTPNAYLGCDPRRPYVSIGLPHGIRRFEFMLLPHESESEAVDRRMLDRMLAGLVPDPGSLDLIRQRVYTHHSRVARSFVQGRVAIAGDAAHLMPVWQGQGFNSGIRDAVNLGWKLACAVRGLAGPELVATYDEERRDHARAMVELSDNVGKVVSVRDHRLARLRDAVFSGLNLVPAAKRYITEMRFKPMPYYRRGAVVHTRGCDPAATAVGRMFPQPEVVTREGGEQRLDEALGPWFSVLVWGNSPTSVLDADALAAWRRLGARLVEVRPVSQLHRDSDPDVTVVGDSTGVLKRWFDATPHSVAVLRPDRFVAGSAVAQNSSALTRDLSKSLHLTRGDDDDDQSVLPVALAADGVLRPAP